MLIIILQEVFNNTVNRDSKPEINYNFMTDQQKIWKTIIYSNRAALMSSTMKIRSLFSVYFFHFPHKGFMHSYVLLNEYWKNETLKSCLTAFILTKVDVGSFIIIIYFVTVKADKVFRNPLGKKPQLTDFASEV